MHFDTRIQQSQLVESLKGNLTEHELSITHQNKKYAKAVAVLTFYRSTQKPVCQGCSAGLILTLFQRFVCQLLLFFPSSLVNACSSTSLKLLFSRPPGMCKDGTFAQMRLFYHFVDAAPPNQRMQENPHSQHALWMSSPSSLCLLVLNHYLEQFLLIFYQVWFILTIYRGCKWLLLTHFKVETGALAGFTRSIFAHTELSMNKLAKFSLTVSQAAVSKASKTKALSGLPISLIKSFNRPIRKRCTMKDPKC